jgi:Family of unknown function (DUF6527)
MNEEKMILRRVSPPERGDGSNHADFIFWCPGCRCGHGIWTTQRNSWGGHWQFNGNMERPTFSPSLLITHDESTPPVTPENIEQWQKQPWPQTKVRKVCHSFITDGKIQFLPDCTHELRGQTVPMEPF